MLFPGTGFPADLGGPARRERRSTWRCRRAPPTRAGCGPSTPSCRRCCASSRPDVLVTQQGCDSHRDDPLAHLALSVDGQRASYLALHDLAHEAAGGRWVAFGGGGYAVVDVVPRTWTHLLAVVVRPPARPGDRDPGLLARRGDRPARRTRALTDERRSHSRLSRTGPRATTRTPGWTGRCSPPGTRCSRTTVWIPTSEQDVRRSHGCDASGHAGVSPFTLGNLWHIGHIWPYISLQTARVVRSGEAVGRATRKCGAPCPRTFPETSPT